MLLSFDDRRVRPTGMRRVGLGVRRGLMGLEPRREMNSMSVQEVGTFDPIQANDIDAELERSLTNEWDAKIMTYPNERFPFNEWIRDRIRMMGFPVEDLSYFHEVVPQSETYRVTKQLCADTNLRSEEHTSELQSHSFISY